MKSWKKRSRSSKEGSWDWIYLVASAGAFLGGLFVIVYVAFATEAISGKENIQANLWRTDYWKAPVPVQGPIPQTLHPLAQKLKAKDCGNCHLDRYQEWSQSLHRHSMGPGVAGQYPEYPAQQIAGCNVCHAPMSEQWSELKVEGQWAKNQDFDPSLEQEGVTCSACHLRKHQRNGPPLREGREALSQALHGEPQRTPFFEASEFCRGCHQHEAQTLKIGGNTIENTYGEWLQSPAYTQGKTCQSCHMPDRKHLWKGIHDKAMTASGVQIDYKINTEFPKTGDSFAATLTLTNTGTGHYFPTYTTPAVFLKATFLNVDGKAIPKYFEEKVIQRSLNMSTQPWTEYFDTRLAPGESVTLEFERTIPQEATRFKLWIWVIPDHFYEGFYRNILQKNPNHQGIAQLKQALDDAVHRQYALFAKTLTITPP
ncbi:hypothetical protein WDW89_08900 [Deltaproteobacteria bacterium TL4]